jgi:hypothetical protein
MPATSASLQPGPAKDGSWEAYGIHGDQLGAEEYARAVADVQRRVANLWALQADAQDAA